MKSSKMKWASAYNFLGRIFCRCAAKNWAIRSKSSKAPMRFLWAFRFYPLRYYPEGERAMSQGVYGFTFF
jgi:hypothetical protein